MSSHFVGSDGKHYLDSGLESSEFYDASQFHVKVNAYERGSESFDYLSAEVTHKGLSLSQTIKAPSNEALIEKVVSQLREWDKTWKASNTK